MKYYGQFLGGDVDTKADAQHQRALVEKNLVTVEYSKLFVLQQQPIAEHDLNSSGRACSFVKELVYS